MRISRVQPGLPGEHVAHASAPIAGANVMAASIMKLKWAEGAPVIANVAVEPFGAVNFEKLPSLAASNLFNDGRP